MAAGAKFSEHPDANLLTAFSEQTLAARERDSLLTHLSQCSDCREIIFLAAPQIEIENEIVPVRSGWMSWPTLRWAALAACGVIVVAAVNLRDRSQRIASFSDAAPQVAMTQAEPSSGPKAQPATPSGKDEVAMDYKSRADADRREKKVATLSKSPAIEARAARSANAPAQHGTDKLGGAMGGSVFAMRDMSVQAKPDAPAAAPEISQEVQVTGESAADPTESAEVNLGKAKPALQGTLSAENKVAKNEGLSAVTGVAPLLSKKLTPRWTLSADGTLQRSLDAGKTWKTIPVAPDATLTAVAAMESNIWVGGSHGALYHSQDAGDHWAQITPASDGQPLTSNIIGIEFSDALHGKITTADQEIWTTADGGQTWSSSQ